MPAGFKLSMAATPLHYTTATTSRPYNWVRTTTVTTASTSAPSCLSSLNSNNYRERCRLATLPCAPPAHGSNRPFYFYLYNTTVIPYCYPTKIYSHKIKNKCNNNNNNSSLFFLGFPSRALSFSLFSSSPVVPSINNNHSRKSRALFGSDRSFSGSGMGSESKIEGNADVDWHRNVNNDNSNNNLNVHKQPPFPSSSPSKFLTLPTLLTLGRVAAVPLLVCTFYVDDWWGRTATTGIFIAAAITDWLDGYLARKMRLGTPFGAFLDPVADKLMVAATLILLCSKPLETAMFGEAPWLLTLPSIAIIGREITMSAVREWAASQNTKLLEAVAVNNLGKWKTATQMTALTILLAARDSGLGGPGALVASGVVLLYISAGLSVWSLAIYMSKIWRVLLK